jgi:hypothetical protein
MLRHCEVTSNQASNGGSYEQKEPLKRLFLLIKY